MMPKAGGQYVYLRESYSPLWGFLYGWTLFLVIQTGTIAAVAVAFARFLGVLAPPSRPTAWIVAPIRLSAKYALSLSWQQLIAHSPDRVSDRRQHPRPAPGKMDPEYFHLGEDARADRADRPGRAVRAQRGGAARPISRISGPSRARRRFAPARIS